jgi:hypothetical protein
LQVCAAGEPGMEEKSTERAAGLVRASFRVDGTASARIASRLRAYRGLRGGRGCAVKWPATQARRSVGAVGWEGPRRTSLLMYSSIGRPTYSWSCSPLVVLQIDFLIEMRAGRQ